MGITTDMRKLSLGMSNFDRSIDDGLAEALQAAPGEVWAQHSAWNFCGRVYYYRGQFYEEVWRYCALCETLSAPTLEALMKQVSEKYGEA